ncbi:MAG: efflux RND transporter periplasmic adaptor subunit [Novosphingobium sp.]
MNDISPPAAETAEEFLDQPPKSARRTKLWVALAVGAVVLLLVMFFVLRSGSSGPHYATAPVTRGNMTVFVNATGNLAPTNEVSVGSELSGVVNRVYVDVNNRVVRGQPLAQLDTRTQVDQIRRTEAALQQARASVLQAQASIAQSRTALARLEEVRRLSGGKVPAATELDQARAQYQRDVAAVASASASVSSSQAQLATDRTNLEKATVRSPVNGVILSRQIEPGQTVAASFNTPTLFVIAEDLTKMELKVKVDEADVGQVREGQPATFAVDAYPGRAFNARIIRVNVGSNTATGTASVVSYDAVLAVDNPELTLRPGMTATADIRTSTQANVLMVPNAALRFTPRSAATATSGFSMFKGPGGGAAQEVTIGRGSIKTIYVVEADGKLRPLQVRIGDSDGAQTIVSNAGVSGSGVSGSGVKPGMQIVTGELAAAK